MAASTPKICSHCPLCERIVVDDPNAPFTCGLCCLTFCPLCHMFAHGGRLQCNEVYDFVMKNAVGLDPTPFTPNRKSAAHATLPTNEPKTIHKSQTCITRDTSLKQSGWCCPACGRAQCHAQKRGVVRCGSVNDGTLVDGCGAEPLVETNRFEGILPYNPRIHASAAPVFLYYDDAFAFTSRPSWTLLISLEGGLDTDNSNSRSIKAHCNRTGGHTPIPQSETETRCLPLGLLAFWSLFLFLVLWEDWSHRRRGSRAFFANALLSNRPLAPPPFGEGSRAREGQHHKRPPVNCLLWKLNCFMSCAQAGLVTLAALRYCTEKMTALEASNYNSNLCMQHKPDVQRHSYIGCNIYEVPQCRPMSNKRVEKPVHLQTNSYNPTDGLHHIQSLLLVTFPTYASITLDIHPRQPSWTLLISLEGGLDTDNSNSRSIKAHCNRTGGHTPIPQSEKETSTQPQYTAGFELVMTKISPFELDLEGL
ncbi:hypothetical protein Pelo_8097 [Pelomyxa schiedti]|nr:hypothetical protein Pelo_8097 [Pelomyxa schiedti]